MLGLPKDLEMKIMKMKFDEETKDYQAFIDDFKVELGEYKLNDDYYDKEDNYQGCYEYEVKLTYIPRSVSVIFTYTYTTYMCRYDLRPSKKMIINQLKSHARFATIGEWKRVTDRSGEWYYNSTIGIGDVCKAKLALWNDHMSLLKMLLGTRFDKFISL